MVYLTPTETFHSCPDRELEYSIKSAQAPSPVGLCYRRLCYQHTFPAVLTAHNSTNPPLQAPAVEGSKVAVASPK